MARTTLNLDPPILEELKRVGKEERVSLGRLASDLLAEALSHREPSPREPSKFHWNSRPMGARVDLDDKEALFRALDGEGSISPA